MTIKEKALAKINLGLDVLGLRADRYHEVALVMASVGLADCIEIEAAPELTVTTDREDLSCGPDNLAWKAAVLMGEFANREPNVHIHIHKRIFIGAGLAGGSTDAAAVLRGLNRFWDLGAPTDRLERLGASLGADVPFCVAGGVSLATGKGEILHPLPDLPEWRLVLAKPKVSVSTPWAYREFDKQKNVVHPDIPALCEAVREGDRDKVLSLCGNVLEPVTAGEHPVIGEIHRRMRENGALFSMMSGSGPTVFGFVEDDATAEKIVKGLLDLDLELAVTCLMGRNG